MNPLGVTVILSKVQLVVPHTVITTGRPCSMLPVDESEVANFRAASCGDTPDTGVHRSKAQSLIARRFCADRRFTLKVM